MTSEKQPSPKVVCPHCLLPVYTDNDYVPKDRIKEKIKALEASFVAGTCNFTTIDGVALQNMLHKAKIEELNELLD